MKLIMLPTSSVTDREDIISIEYLEDGEHARIVTRVSAGCHNAGSIRRYPRYPLDMLSIRVE